ncbi:MAG: hypothetical protein WA977_00950 [Halobacteriota archaeon]
MGLADRDYMKKDYQNKKFKKKPRYTADGRRIVYRKIPPYSSSDYNPNSPSRRLKSRLTQKYYDFKRWFFRRKHPYSKLRLGKLATNLGLAIGLTLALFIVLSYLDLLNSIAIWFIGLGIVIALLLLYFILKNLYKVFVNLRYGIRGLTNGAKLILIILFILVLWQVYQIHPDTNMPEKNIGINGFIDITPVQEAVSNLTENITAETFASFKPARETFNESPKLQSYSYYLNGRKSLSFTTYGGLADYLAKEDHSYYHDYEEEVIMELLQNDYQDEYLETFLEEVRGLSKSPDIQAEIVISLVQHIPYNWGGLYTISSDFLYPYETLYRNRGVCCDKSILLAYLLDQLGYDVVLFEWECQHMAVGIRCDEGFDFQNTGYAFIETTRPTIISYVSDDYIGGFRITSSPNVIHVSKGGRALDVSQEYNDAQELKKIEVMGTVLDQYYYSRWLAISNKYDLQYDT